MTARAGSECPSNRRWRGWGAAGLGAAAAGLAAGPCRAQFVNNDLYLISTVVTGSGGLCNAGAVLRINPVGWQASVAASFPGGQLTGRGAYDPYRDRIVLLFSDWHIELMDSAGVRTMIPSQGTNSVRLAAPVGDGKVILWGTDHMRYIDSANAVHPLLDQTGAAPFSVSGDMGAMIYDAGTNAVFLATYDAAADLTTVIKVPLNAAKTGVQGQTSSTSFDASPGNQTERPVGFSYGPAGMLFLKIDDNSGQTAPRMQLITPATLQNQPYASTGYFGVGGETAGAYSPLFDRGIVLDTLAPGLRSFTQGQSGAGTAIPLTGTALTCGAGEAAQLIVIRRGATGCYANCDNSTTPPILNVNDFICFQTKFAAGNSYANCDGSTSPPVLNVNDFICFQTHFASGCP